jgi:hypothetical protein
MSTTIERLDEIREAHLDLSAQDWAFRDIARQSPELLDRASFPLFDQPNDLITYRLQSWPTFVRRAKLDELARASVGVSELVRGIPRRIFGGDPAAIARFYGVNNPMLIEILLDAPNGIAGAVARGDFIHDRSGFKCIELNVIPNLGGWETGILAGMHLATPATARLIAQLGNGTSYTDVVDALFAHLLREGQAGARERGGEINVAILSFDMSTAKMNAFQRHVREKYQAFLPKTGLPLYGEAWVCEVQELSFRGPYVQHGDRRIHALVEMGTETDQRIFRCFKAGYLNLYNGPLWRMLSDKRNIALLSDEEVESDFSAEERSFIESCVPWTRLVKAEQTSFHGDRVFLPDFLNAHRTRLVLKNSLLYGGKQVYVGLFTPPDRWAEVIRSAIAESHWVAQEHVPSRPYLYQNGSSGCSVHDVIWGPFVFGNRYDGVILRMQPAADQTAVNLSLTATEGMVFEVEEDAGD